MTRYRCYSVGKSMFFEVIRSVFPLKTREIYVRWPCVLRMQQSRHKTMSQPMLNLKRLYWNCHEFGSGPRKGISPYRRLGLKLPTFDFWTLLQADPAELTQELSASQSTE